MHQTPKNTLKSAVWAFTQAKQITATTHKVLMQLIGHLKGTECHPSMTTLAAEAGCSVRSVIRAIQAAEELGIVKRAMRMVREGVKVVRTSNAYSFTLDASQQAQNAAQAMFEKAKRAAEFARNRYRAFLGLSDKEAGNPCPLYSSRAQAPQMSREDMLIFIGQWDEAAKINTL